MKEWLKDDYKVYNHFKTKLETNIEDFGALNLSRELAKYHQVQDKIKAKCPIQFVPKSSLPVDDRPFGFGTEAYKILNRDPDCQFLGMQELKFTSYPDANIWTWTKYCHCSPSSSGWSCQI